MECSIGAMDVEEIGVASAEAPMVDDDNKPAPENCLSKWTISSLDGCIWASVRGKP